MEQISLWVAFGAGIASFISPCCLPLYPSYLSYITGISVRELKEAGTASAVRRSSLIHTLFFILGFSLIFYSLGFGAGVVGDLFRDFNNKELLRRLAAIWIFLMGLFLLGVFKPQFLMKERKLNIKWKPAGWLGSVIVGMGFAAGWSPCVGPILGSILTLAATEPGSWFSLITAYVLGFAIPFFVLAFFIGSTKWITRYSGTVMKIGGVVMIVMAVLLFFDRMTLITIWLNERTPDWLKF
ncbi:cytochrome c biogenesis CcdA family protein [Paenibacillus thermoaerophilus]|uniref:Cytochrome c biogenesis CcdA family protein n=1 Tax=Paenibacillus thermoaerophilus TaxID=1215385 RepID=A0ABW2V4I9_9BACL|nr:cytochrome c biogenesis protein CcdA [Paenibacillus thermoaerophilus]TMV18805.1 cytochrome c biogenesis protein CcdA [Paenibacillus thermoaerophilus]